MGISGRHVEFYGVPDRCTGIVDSGTSSLEAYLVSRNNWSSFCNIITRLTLAYSPLSVLLPSKGWFCPKMSSRKSWSLWIRRLVLIDHTNKPGIKMHLHIRNIQKSSQKNMSERLSKDTPNRMSEDMSEKCQKICPKEWQKSEDMSERYGRIKVRKYARKNVRRLPPVSLWSSN